MDKGERVGAILDSKDGVVRFLGYGVYAGREVPPNTGSNSLSGLLAEMLMGNPKICLDNGDVVWGCECWWGPEEQIKAELAKHDRVEIVSIADHRGPLPPPKGFTEDSLNEDD